MKQLIRKTLMEIINEASSPKRPEWSKTLNNLTRDERMEVFKNNKKHIELILPKAVKFFQVKFKDSLRKIDIVEKLTHYGNENFSIKHPVIKFYFEFDKMGMVENAKQEIRNDFSSFFDIDFLFYGMPLDVEVYQISWERV